MRKFLIASLAALVAVSGFAVIAQATDGTDGTSWNFKFTTKKTKKSTGTNSLVKPSKRMADGSFVAAAKNVVYFPKGSKFNSSAAPLCKAPPHEFAKDPEGSCKKNTIVGDGRAVSMVGATAYNAELEAYNKKDGFWFVIQPCDPPTGPPSGGECKASLPKIILDAKLDYADRKKQQPRLTVDTPKQLLDNNIVIETFELTTRKITKGKGKKAKFYVTTPSKCKGSWVSRDEITYEDGSKQTIKHKAPCKK